MFRTRLTSLAITLTLVATVLVGGSAEAVVKKNISLPKLPTMVGVGESVAVTAGRWSQAVKFSYQWLVDGRPVKGATKTTYKLPTTAMGKQLSVVETAKFSDGKSMFANSAPRKVGQLIITGNTSINYKDAEHSALVLTAPSTSKAGVTQAFSWYAGESLIEGENGTELKIDKRFDSLSVTARAVYALVGYESVTLNANSIGFAAPAVTDDHLIWSDEFYGETGTGPNLQDWNDVTGNGRNFNDPIIPVANGWGNLERQYYLPGASVISDMQDASDGKGLLITATNQSLHPNPAGAFPCWYSYNWKGVRNGPDCEWTSGKITTEDKIGFLYGHLEARVKSTGTAGTWPAFWMLGQDLQKNGWPGCGEIDIHEGNGALPNSNWGTIHGYSYWPGGQKSQSTSMIAGWHTYGLDWKPNYIAFSVDGEIYKTITANDLKTTPWNLDLAKNGWEFNKPQFAILNLAVGGRIIGNNNLPVKTTDINKDTKTMQVDYIRYSSLDGYGTLIRY
jgi:hypothetical protein